MGRTNNKKGSILLTATIILMILAVGAISFTFWLNVQSKGVTRKKLIAKEQYYGEVGIQKALRRIQESPQLQTQMSDDYPTHFFILNLVMEDGTSVEVSAWDVP